MGDLYTIDTGGGVFQQLVPEFDSALEAEQFAVTIGHPGTAQLRSAWNSSAEFLSQQLEELKGAKLLELTAEGDRRTLAVHLLFTSVAGAYVLAISVNALTATGSAAADVGTAWGDAVAVVVALADAAAVDAYDVVTDPGWP